MINQIKHKISNNKIIKSEIYNFVQKLIKIKFTIYYYI